MPKYGIHHIVLQKVQDKLNGSADSSMRDLHRILTQNQFASNLGCIGPDLLFWAPDYGIVASLKELVTNYDRVMQMLEPLEEFGKAIEDHIENGVEAVVDAVGQVPIIGPVVSTTYEYAQAFAAMKEGFENLAEAVGDEVRQAFFLRIMGLDGAPGSEENTLARSLFHGLFQSSQQAGREEYDWYWFEMLHYRKTGDFLDALIRRAEASGDEQQMAYAYGYATHVATDLVGHPFVNTISGSPYRINVQRHVVIENFMDQWKWSSDGLGNIRNTLFKEFGFGDAPNLPNSIAKLLVGTMEEVYKEVVHPLRHVEGGNSLAERTGLRLDRDGFLTEEDIKTAYTFQKLMLEFIGGQEEHVRPPEPFPGADAYLADLLSGGGINIPPPPSMPSTPLPGSIEEFFAAIAAWFMAAAEFVQWLVEAIVEIADAVVDAIAEFLENPAQNLLRLIQALAYAIQLFVYDIYRMIHQVLALSGLAYPEPDDAVLSNPIAEALVTTRKVQYKQYPILRTPGQPHLDTRSHVPFMSHRNHPDFADGHYERPGTVASFYRQEDAQTPDGFIDGVRFNQKLLSSYARAESPEQTRALHEAGGGSFGNAVELSLFMLQHRNDPKHEDVVFCNWNLDGDRGYGYKSWDGVPFTAIKGELDGAIDGNESLEELKQQGFSVWTRATEQVSNGARSSRYAPETYVDDKLEHQTLLSALAISEYFIPSMFTDPRRMGDATTQRWAALVPSRLALHTGSPFTNVIFCNGMTSTPSSGIRCTMDLQKTLNAAFDGLTNTPFRLRHLHNYTSMESGDLYFLMDVIQSVAGDYLSSLRNNDALEHGQPPVPITNPTQVAAIALLHHGMEQRIPLVLAGHSQGCIILANAIMVFSTLGKAQTDYLREHVKLFHMEPELTIPTRDRLRSLVRAYLVYMMNNSDPLGSDLLMEAASYQFPLIPGQPGGLLREGMGMAALNNLLANPRPLDVTYYLGVLAAVNGFGGDLSDLIGYISRVNMRAHFMPVQLPIIAEDIRLNRFRTDPGTLTNPSVQLSTPSALNGLSVRVRDFFST